MDLALTEQQAMLQTSAADLLRRELPKDKVLELNRSADGFDPHLWRQMADLGWTAMVVPETAGGLGSSLTDVGALFEILGQYACPLTVFTSGVLSAQVLAEAGASAHGGLLSEVATGEKIVTFAYTEPDYGWGPGAVQLPATRRDGAYVLNGTKLFVPDAHIADSILVAARTGAGADPGTGMSIFLVEKEQRGLSVRQMSGWLGDRLCEVTLDSVEVPASAMVGDEGGAWSPIDRAIDRATAVLCAYMAGGARRATDMAIEYSRTRIAFGVPIGTFQRVQDRIIDANDDADSIRLTAYEALWKLDSGHDDAPLAVSTAKAVASVGFPRACEASHHVHGGIGTDHTLGLVEYTGKARTLQPYLGDAAYHKRRIARLLAPRS